MVQAYPLALVAAAFLSLHGYRKGSLATSGAIAAFVVGYLTLANEIFSFGITMLSFYLIGSRATKAGHEIKARLEREYIIDDDKKKDSHHHKAKSGGQRDWVQVCCNGLGGAITSILFRTLYSDQWQSGKAWCLLRSSRITTATFLGIPFPHQTASTLPRSLFLMMLGHFAVSGVCVVGLTFQNNNTLIILFESAVWVTPWPPRLVFLPNHILVSFYHLFESFHRVQMELCLCKEQ